MREALNGRPPTERTRRDYQRVLNAYRSVYYGAPTSSKADPSAVAVAETLVEMGRRFELAREKLEPGALVVADNVLSHPDPLARYSASRQADPTLVSVTVPLDRGLELTVVLR